MNKKQVNKLNLKLYSQTKLVLLEELNNLVVNINCLMDQLDFGPNNKDVVNKLDLLYKRKIEINKEIKVCDQIISV